MPKDLPTSYWAFTILHQGWRADGDISTIMSKIDTQTPSVVEVMTYENYITRYMISHRTPPMFFEYLKAHKNQNGKESHPNGFVLFVLGVLRPRQQQGYVEPVS